MVEFKGVSDYSTSNPAKLREDLQRQNAAIADAFREYERATMPKWATRPTSRGDKVRHGELLLVDAAGTSNTYTLPLSSSATAGLAVRFVRSAGTNVITVAAQSKQLVNGAAIDTIDETVTIREYVDSGRGYWERHGAGNTISPLSNTFWVDKGAPDGGDGSIARPFNTVTAGVAAVSALANKTGNLYILPYDYSAEPTLVFAGLTIGFFCSTSASLPSINATGTVSSIVLHGCGVSGLTLDVSSCEATLSSIPSCSGTTGSRVEIRGAGRNEGGTSFSGTVATLIARGVYIGASTTVQAYLTDCFINNGVAFVATSDCSFENCIFGGFGGGADAVTSPTIRMDRFSECSAALPGTPPSTAAVPVALSSLPVPLGPVNPIYGSGITGAVTQSTSAILSHSAEYDSLTMASGGRIRCENAILKVRNLLSLTAAGADAITDYTGGAGGNASGATGGAAWGGTAGYSQGTAGTLNVPGGANGGKGAGAQPTAPTAIVSIFGGGGGAGGGGGDGDGGVGGAGRAAQTVTNAREPMFWPLANVGPSTVVTGGGGATAPLVVYGGGVGASGSAGGGSSSGAGSDGGGGGTAGRGGGVLVIFARGISIGASTPAGAISANGQAGGNGAAGTGGNSGGGGAGAGGGGGGVLICYDWIIGTPPAADEVSASGGAGGNGGAGAGTGTAGTGGGGGNGGQITLLNMLTGVRRVVSGGSGGTASGSTGGAAGACTADL